MEIKEYVIGFFESKKPLPVKTEQEKLEFKYLDNKFIDSMGIMDMVMDFESKFGITFDAEDMQSYEFQTIGGLIQLISKLKS